MMRILQGFMLVALLVVTGCSDDAVNPTDTLGSQSNSFLQDGASLLMVGDGSLAVVLPEENSEVITLENASTANPDYRTLFEQAIADGYDMLLIISSPGKPDIIKYSRFEDAVVWDGISPLESGVLYDMSGNKEIMAVLDSKETAAEKAEALMDEFIKRRSGN